MGFKYYATSKSQICNPCLTAVRVKLKSTFKNVAATCLSREGRKLQATGFKYYALQKSLPDGNQAKSDLKSAFTKHGGCLSREAIDWCLRVECVAVSPTTSRCLPCLFV
jgi:hypothetical protein